MGCEMGWRFHRCMCFIIILHPLFHLASSTNQECGNLLGVDMCKKLCYEKIGCSVFTFSKQQLRCCLTQSDPKKSDINDTVVFTLEKKGLARARDNQCGDGERILVTARKQIRCVSESLNMEIKMKPTEGFRVKVEAGKMEDAILNINGTEKCIDDERSNRKQKDETKPNIKQLDKKHLKVNQHKKRNTYTKETLFGKRLLFAGKNIVKTTFLFQIVLNTSNEALQTFNEIAFYQITAMCYSRTRRLLYISHKLRSNIISIYHLKSSKLRQCLISISIGSMALHDSTNTLFCFDYSRNVVCQVVKRKNCKIIIKIKHVRSMIAAPTKKILYVSTRWHLYILNDFTGEDTIIIKLKTGIIAIEPMGRYIYYHEMTSNSVYRYNTHFRERKLMFKPGFSVSNIDVDSKFIYVHYVDMSLKVFRISDFKIAGRYLFHEHYPQYLMCLLYE